MAAHPLFVLVVYFTVLAVAMFPVCVWALHTADNRIRSIIMLWLVVGLELSLIFVSAHGWDIIKRETHAKGCTPIVLTRGTI